MSWPVMESLVSVAGHARRSEVPPAFYRGERTRHLIKNEASRRSREPSSLCSGSLLPQCLRKETARRSSFRVVGLERCKAELEDSLPSRSGARGAHHRQSLHSRLGRTPRPRRR